MSHEVPSRDVDGAPMIRVRHPASPEDGLRFFSVLGGLNVFGVLGVVLGPVVLAITLALIDVYRTAGRSTTADKAL